MDCSPPGSSDHGESPGKNTGMPCHALLQGNLPNPGIEPRSPALQADSLPAEPPKQPKNTGMNRLSLLQGIFPAQESNQGLLPGRRILYQLSYQGSPPEDFAMLLLPRQAAWAVICGSAGPLPSRPANALAPLPTYSASHTFLM